MLAGCVGGDDDEDDDEEPTPVDPALRLDDRALSSAFPVELVDEETGDTAAEVQWHEEYAHWHFAPVEIPVGTSRSFRVRFVYENNEELDVGESEAYRVRVQVAGETPDDLFEPSVEGAIVTLTGESVGEGELDLQLTRSEDVVWTAPPLPIEVTESEDDS